MPKVYLIAQPSVTRSGKQPDLSSLSEYGEIVVVLPEGARSGFERSRSSRDMIFKRLQHFDPDRDYLVWAGGDTLAAVLIGVALERMGVRKIRWLRFHRAVDEDGHRTHKGGRYVEHECAIYEAQGAAQD